MKDCRPGVVQPIHGNITSVFFVLFSGTRKGSEMAMECDVTFLFIYFLISFIYVSLLFYLLIVIFL